MNPALAYGVFYGLGIALLYAELHLILVRLLGRPLLEQKTMAMWIHATMNLAIVAITLLSFRQARLVLIENGCPAATLLPFTLLGLTLYLIAFFHIVSRHLVRKAREESEKTAETHEHV